MKETAWGAWLQVNKRETLPSSMLGKGAGVYNYIEITRSSTLKDDTFKDAKVNFKVEKSWLDEKKLSKEQVSLYHYVDGKWSELKTTATSQDGSYAYYSADVPGFSYYAIAQNMVLVVPKAEVTPPVLEGTKEAIAQEVVSERAEVVIGTEATSSNRGWIVATVFVALVIVGVAVWLLKRKQKPQHWTKNWDIKHRGR